MLHNNSLTHDIINNIFISTISMYMLIAKTLKKQLKQRRVRIAQYRQTIGSLLYVLVINPHVTG